MMISPNTKLQPTNDNILPLIFRGVFSAKYVKVVGRQPLTPKVKIVLIINKVWKLKGNKLLNVPNIIAIIDIYIINGFLPY